VANSAAQVSTRLYTGRTPSVWRCRRTAVSSHAEQLGQAAVGEALALQLAQLGGVEAFERAPGERLLRSRRTMSSIWARNQGSILVSSCTCSRLMPARKAWPTYQMRSGAGLAISCSMIVAVGLDLVEAVRRRLQPAQRLLQRFLEGAADRHHLADRLHLRGQAVVGLRELLEREARDLGDDVVDRRLEAGRRRAAGDVVAQLVERVADGQLGRDLGDREAGRLRGQRRERDTRGFISMTIMRPSTGLIANCTFEPPVSTPISRSTAIEASRMIWYSLSVSVCAGATVIESPVCTPIGSRFSIEQMMMQLSARRGRPPSRIPSSRSATPRSAARWSATGLEAALADLLELLRL
jgi:hypothetical protein